LELFGKTNEENYSELIKEYWLEAHKGLFFKTFLFICKSIL
jgi:hypothetical protein